MHKMIISTVAIVVLLLGFSSPTIDARAETEVIPLDQPPSLMEKAFLRSLGETIFDVMRHHGDHQLFEFGRIEEITGDDPYDVTLSVIGFEGPHNPPHKFIRMTLRIPGKAEADYTVLSYSHRHLSRKEYRKLTQYR
ncbi:hypothetical protein JNUCC1_01579 [Lentibacillus sp. JNUCC-1]|uniref:hypothetical protein n=1 Tax=Lentibacillus sp. JNUCC-1 TaxID=2654513 RepID=UPI0012E9345D|nr:hypothetical protein [Lentibacillus sp. JNUCC-1]MUV37773.1 hypothetical protein [Lentibacillus sp. JNUCC-1]